MSLKQRGKKTISVDENTHRELCEFGKKGESFNVIIKRLLNIAKREKIEK